MDSRKSFWMIWIAILCAVTAAFNELDEEMQYTKKHDRTKRAHGIDVSPYRLPSTVYPISYNITIHPYFGNFTFSGTETIDIVLTRDALFHENDWLTIELNAFDIMMNYVMIYIDDMKQAIPMRAASVDTTTQIVSMEFKIRNKEVLKYMKRKGYSHGINAMLYIEYIGIIQIDMKGFYISSFHHDGKLIHNGVTHFEATNARKFYPCFDEPAMKATFTMSVVAPKHAMVIGNTMGHEKPSKKKDCYFLMHDGEHYDCKVVDFKTTPKMSTYLTAMAIGDYQYVEGKMNGVMQRIYFPLQNKKRAAFALDMSLKVLTYFEHLLDMKFPLEKMYSLAVNDFKAGAMENLGLVTYRDIRLMCDERKSTLSIKQHVALVIAHEFSHQWFGNQITMEWWSDIWLNEGFAAFMEFVGGDHVHPEYALWDLFFFETHRAMLRDASAETHSIVLRVEDPTDVKALFDGITYHKGAGLLHMLREYLGEETFFGKLREYLKKFRFSNANTAQLFDVLDNGDGKIKTFMDSWVRQPGVPMIKVKCTEEDGDKLRFVLTQERIRPKLGGSLSPRIGKEQIWEIPIKVKDAAGTSTDLDLMKHKSVEFTLDRVHHDDDELYMLNPSMQAFAFTYYDAKSLDMIVKSFNALSKVDQFLVVADRFSVMSFNYLPAVEFVEFIHKVVSVVDIENNKEINSLFWRVIIDALANMDDLFCGLHQSRNAELRRLRLDFRRFALDILQPVWEKIGGFGKGNNIHEKNVDITTLRPLLLMALVRFGDEAVIEKGSDILHGVLEKHGGHFKMDSDSYIDCFEDIDQNILEQLMEAALSHHDSKGSDEVMFNALLSIYGEANNEMQSMVLGALGAVYERGDLLEAAVNFVLSHAVRLNVKGHGMASLRRCYGREHVWMDLLRRSHGAPRQVGMASTFAKQSVYNAVYSYYFGVHNGRVLKLPESKERIIKSVLEKMATNIKFVSSNKFGLMKWLKEYMANREDGRSSALEAFEGNVLHSIGSRHRRRHKEQINGITRHSETLSPRQSLMLICTLFFVVISCCLIAMWVYSVHKNTFII